jgi:hypothetical protein
MVGISGKKLDVVKRLETKQEFFAKKRINNQQK